MTDDANSNNVHPFNGRRDPLRPYRPVMTGDGREAEISPGTDQPDAATLIGRLSEIVGAMMWLADLAPELRMQMARELRAAADTLTTLKAAP